MYIGLFILLISLVGSIGTYAWFTWSSTDNTSVTLSIGELADVTFNTGPDIKVDNLSPVYNYTDGVYTTFNITNRDTTSNLLYTVKLNITSIDTELQDKTFKYVLLENDKIVGRGNFENAQSDTTLTLYTGVLDKGVSSNNTTSTYKLYFYIDGNEENNPNMMNKSLIGKIDVSLEGGVSISLDKYITNLYNKTNKSTVVNNSITYNYASSESLMNDRLGGIITSLDGGNIRYYGASPNNYIYFNCTDYSNQTSNTCELWRIIGVFDGKVKIVRDGLIGNLSWDTSESTVNSGSGVNEWNDADLMKLLNPGYESESIGGSLYYNGKSGQYYYGGNNGTTSIIDFSKLGIKNDTTRNMIADVNWSLGGFSSSSIYSNQVYQYERGDTVYSGRSTMWTGKIALMYLSDYGYAADFDKCDKELIEYNDSACTSNNWLFLSGYYFHLLSPNSYNPDVVWGINDTGRSSTEGYVASNTISVRPSLYLISDISMTSGNGSKSNPYKLSGN